MPSPWDVITRDIRDELDRVQAERDNQRRAIDLQRRIASERKWLSPYVKSIKDEVLGNWEFYLTVILGLLFVSSVYKRVRR